jgi:hypothetical protein
MKPGRASFTLAFLAVIGLCVASTASSAGTQRVTASTTFVVGSTTCTPPAPKAQNLTVEHCTGGKEMWTGDITGTGFYSFDRVTNLASGTAVLMNGVETIKAACVLGTCGGDLFSKWHEHDQESGSFLIEQSFHGGTGPFAKAHGSIRIVDLELSVYTGQLGF